LAVICAAALAAEFGVRWAVEGGFGPALASFQPGDSARPFEGSRDGLIFDAELGYRPDPKAVPANLREVTDPAGEPARIVVLRDAVPQGLTGGSDQPERFVGLLQAALGSRAEVVDASISGYTIHQNRFWLAEQVLPLGPDLVVLAYALDDNHRFLFRLDQGRGLLMREEARRALLPADGGPAAWLAANSYLALRLHFALDDWRTPPDKRFPWDFDYAVGPAWRDESWKPFADDLALMKTATEQADAIMLLVILPIADQFDPELIERDARYVFKPQIKALEAANSLHIAALDLVPEFQRQDGRTLFEANGFDLNARGHVLVADSLKKQILDSGLLPGADR
jgi:lysophospholipase L1-like esterase